MTNGITSSQGWTILKSLAQKAGVEGNLSKQDVEKIMKAADTNNDGSISADEFSAAAKDKVDATEEQYLEAFKVISKNDGDDASISDADIEKAITDFLNGSGTDSTKALDNTESADAANSADSTDTTGATENTAGNTGATNNGSTNTGSSNQGSNNATSTDTTVSLQPTVEAVSLTGEEDLQTLQSGRSDTLAALQEARNQKASLDSDPAVVEANQKVTTAETSYNDSLTALEKKEGEKTETEKAVLEQKALKDENDQAKQAKNEEITAKNEEITAKNEAITAKNEEITAKNAELTAANTAVTNARSSVSSLQGSEPQQSDYKKTERRESQNSAGQTVYTEVEVDDTAAYNAAHSAWEAQLEAAEAALKDAENQVTETQEAIDIATEELETAKAELEVAEAELAEAEAELTNMEMDLLDSENQLAELEAKEAEIDSKIYDTIAAAEAAGEAVSQELKNVSSNLTAKYEAKQNLAQVKMEKTAQTELDIAQLQANLSVYADAISTAKANEQAENMKDIANDPTKLQEMLDDPEISEAQKLQLVSMANVENPDAVKEVMEDNPDFYNNAISKIAGADGNTMEEVTDAALADALAEIEQRRKEIEAEADSKGFFGRIGDSISSLWGGGTSGELSDLDEIEQLYKEAELNPTVENIEKLNQALNGESVDWAATAKSVETMKNIQNGAYTVNGEPITQEQIADLVMQGVEGLEAGFDQSCDEAGVVTKAFSWLNNNILGFGTTQNMTEAQMTELKAQAEKLANTTDPTEFAAIYKQITGQSLTEGALSQLCSGESNPVENSAAAESMVDYDNTNDTLKTTAISIGTAALCAIPGVGWIGAAAIGLGMNVGVNALDAATQNNDKSAGENLKDYIFSKDCVQDALVGALNGFTGKLGNAAGNALKTLSKTSPNIATRIAGKIGSEFVDGAVDGSISSVGEYVLDELFDGKSLSEIDWKDAAKQGAIGGMFGGSLSMGMSAAGSLFKGIKSGDVVGEFAGVRTLPDSWSSKGAEFEVDGQKMLEYDDSYFKYDSKSKTWIEMSGDEIDSVIAKANTNNTPDVQANVDKPLGLPEGQEPLALPEGQEPLALPEGRGEATTTKDLAPEKNKAQIEANNKQIEANDKLIADEQDVPYYKGQEEGLAYLEGQNDVLKADNARLETDPDASTKTSIESQIEANNKQIEANNKLIADEQDVPYYKGQEEGLAYLEGQNDALKDINSRLQTELDAMNKAEVDAKNKAQVETPNKASVDKQVPNSSETSKVEINDELKSKLNNAEMKKVENLKPGESVTVEIDGSKYTFSNVDGKISMTELEGISSIISDSPLVAPDKTDVSSLIDSQSPDVSAKGGSTLSADKYTDASTMFSKNTINSVEVGKTQNFVKNGKVYSLTNIDGKVVITGSMSEANYNQFINAVGDSRSLYNVPNLSESWEVINAQKFGSRLDPNLADYEIKLSTGESVKFRTDNDIVLKSSLVDNPSLSASKVISDEQLSAITKTLEDMRAKGQPVPNEIYFSDLFATTRKNASGVFNSTNINVLSINASDARIKSDIDWLDRTIRHEAAHMTDFNLGTGTYNLSEASGNFINPTETMIVSPNGTVASSDSIKKLISSYSLTNNKEFVAEVSALVSQGRIIEIEPGKYSLKLEADGTYYNNYSQNYFRISDADITDLNKIMSIYNEVVGDDLFSAKPQNVIPSDIDLNKGVQTPDISAEPDIEKAAAIEKTPDIQKSVEPEKIAETPSGEKTPDIQKSVEPEKIVETPNGDKTPETSKKSGIAKKVSELKESAKAKLDEVKAKAEEAKAKKIEAKAEAAEEKAKSIEKTPEANSANESGNSSSTAKAKAQEAIEKLKKLVQQGADSSKIKSLYEKIQKYCSAANLKDLAQKATSILAESGDEMLKRAAVKAAAGLATPSVGGEAPYVNKIAEAAQGGNSETPATETPAGSGETPAAETPTTTPKTTPKTTPGGSPSTTPASGTPATDDSNYDFPGIGKIDFSQDVNYENLLSLDNLIFQTSQEYTTAIDADLQEALETSENSDVVITKEEPLIFHSSETNSFSASEISDEYALNVTGSSDLIKELEQLMTTGTYTVEVNGQEQTIEVDDMTKFMFSTIDDASKWNDTDAPVTLYFEGDINEETLTAIEVITSKYARGEFPEGEGVDNDIPFIKKYENPTDAQMEELHEKASEIDEEFADTILEQSNNLVGMSGLQYAGALEIIEQYEAYLLNSIE